MKKRVLAVTAILCMMMTAVLSGCGSGDKPYGNYDLSEYVKVGEYKGLERDELDISVSKAEVKDRIQAKLDADTGTEKKTKGKVKDGDAVYIDYKGTLNGKAFEGGTAENYKLVIGSGTFIDGFEDGLIGEKIGSEKKLNLTFPKDYNTRELQGKDVVFDVKINYVEQETVPEYNEEWIQKNSKAKTRKEYEELNEKELYEEKESQALQEQKSALWQQVLAESTVKKYPEEELGTYVKQIEDTYSKAAKDAGVEVKDLWEQYGIKSEKEYNDQNKTAAQAYVKQQMVLYYIADKEGLEYTKEQEEKLRSEVEKAGYSEESFREAMGQPLEEYIQMTLTYSEVIDFIYDHAKVKKLSSEEKKAQEDARAEEARGGDNAVSNDQPGGADA